MKSFWETAASLSRSDLALKGLALIIAVGLWLAGHRDIERAVEVPVEFRNIPSDLMVTDNRVDYVVLRVMGPRTLVSTLDSEDVKLALDLNGARSGSASYPLTPTSFNLPRGVTVGRITPPVIHLRLEPVLKRALPVTVRISGKPPPGYKISQTTVVPEKVTVRGPAEELRRISVVETIPVDIEQTRGAIRRKIRLSSDGKPFSFDPDQVEISITLAEEEITRDFDRVVVQAKQFTGEYTVAPRFVWLRLAGPSQTVSKLELDSERVFLNLKGLSVGEHTVPLQLSLPPDVKVVEQKPPRFKVRITKPGT
jgi:YbbR domain-containing protein